MRRSVFEYDVCVIGGCGRVGLPLSLAFSKQGKKVLIHDINPTSVETVRAGIMPFLEKGADSVLKEELRRGLALTSDPKECSKARFVVVTIGTPIREDSTPDISQVQDFIEGLVSCLTDGQILVLRSTVYPGTTDDCKQVLDRSGKKIEIVYCPERIIEGNSLEELYRLPQIVSGYSDGAVEEARNLFLLLAPEIIVTTTKEAELAKLFSNAYRYIHFSISNQFYMVSAAHGADYKNVMDAMTRNYPRNKTFPRPGLVGGPCLYKDTAYLAHYFDKFELGHGAISINQSLPAFIVDELLKDEALSLRTVGILGMAFKPECDDTRNSPSVDLFEILKSRCREVLCSDEYVSEYASVSAEELIRRSDIVIVACPHKRYAGLDYGNKRVINL